MENYHTEEFKAKQASRTLSMSPGIPLAAFEDVWQNRAKWKVAQLKRLSLMRMLWVNIVVIVI